MDYSDSGMVVIAYMGSNIVGLMFRFVAYRWPRIGGRCSDNGNELSVTTGVRLPFLNTVIGSGPPKARCGNVCKRRTPKTQGH